MQNQELDITRRIMLRFVRARSGLARFLAARPEVVTKDESAEGRSPARAEQHNPSYMQWLVSMPDTIPTLDQVQRKLLVDNFHVAFESSQHGI
jgi:hypothetical protein